MTALHSIEPDVTVMAAIGRRARDAATTLAVTPTAAKNAALVAAAAAIRADGAAILAANGEDMAAARAAGLNPAMLDRLALNVARVEAMAE